MAASPFEGPKWGTQGLGTSGGQVTWSFASTVGQYFSFDSAITQAVFEQLVRDAFQTWESIANIDFVEVADSRTVDIRLGWDGMDGAWGSVGQTQFQYSGKGFSHAEIAFDTAENWTTGKTDFSGMSVNFFAVALHEIGHAIGLSHLSDMASIMYPSVHAQASLGAIDIADIQKLYGAALVTTPPPPTGGGGVSAPVPGGVYGTQGADNLSGHASNDIIFGYGGSDTIAAGAGNDRITGGAGNDHIDGGLGLDRAVETGARANYAITENADGSIVIVDTRPGAPDGTDTLTGVERVVFSDGVLAFDIDGNAGDVFRLYQAAFDRQPDLGGLTAWLSFVDKGTTTLDVARQFIASDEFRSLYGAHPTTEQFVTLLYNNVLHRDPEPAGYHAWVDALSTYMTRDTALAAFADSAENQANVIDTIAHGIWLNPDIA